MMKKLLTVLLSVLMICSLVACGSDTGSDDNNPTDNPSNNKATITEQLCFEHDGIKVTAKEMVNDSIWGQGIKLLVENDSGKDYTVSTNEVIVNNCMVTSLFSCDVAAGKKANETLYLSSSSLNAAGITNIGQIEIYFYIYDEATYETVYEADCVTIQTSLFDSMDTAVNDDGHELYNKNGIRIVGKYVDENSFWGASVLLYIENKTKQNITVSYDDLSVNGFMVTSLLASTVYQGKYIIDDIDILSDSLEENGITSIDYIEMKFEIYNADTYKTIATTDVIKFDAK